MKVPVVTGITAFVFFLVLFIIIDSPLPFVGALFVAVFIFEIAFYHHFAQKRDRLRHPSD
ncbi:hypothetical protein [Salimicrobium album]|uniref:Uncharacterized protein n=1 Tax=Salimicrobium album TaxID=50717 RepID=A0A1H3HXY1_9BACI|nr:hypothetical protein [Salimicrobium album]SDY20232.1 hypothetical protein SAMN04488081_2325 [Salimicrobium album]